MTVLLLKFRRDPVCHATATAWIFSLCFQHYHYRAAAFSGVRSFSGVETGGTRVCSVVACKGVDIETCGVRFDNYMAGASAVFEQLSILAAFPTPVLEVNLGADDSAVFPVAMKSSIMPYEPSDYTYEVTPYGDVTYFNFTLDNFSEEMYAFSVWGRVFATDGQEADPPRGASFSHSMSILFLPLIAFVKLLI